MESSPKCSDGSEPEACPSSASNSRVTKTARFFTEKGKGMFECLLCEEGTLVKVDKDGGTNSRWRHLHKFHPREHATIGPSACSASKPPKQRSVDMMLTSCEVSDRLRYVGITDEQSKDELVRFIVRTDCPFTLVDGDALKRLLSYYVQHDVTLPSSQAVQEVAIKLFEDGKEKLRRVLQPVQRLALTVDAWTSPCHVHLMGITVHWVDEQWTLCERVLNLEEINGPHSGEHMGELLYGVLKDFDIMNKVIAITTDNAGNNTVMIRHVKLCLLREGVTNFNTEHHVPCVRHILNLAVQDGLKHLGIEEAPDENEIYLELTGDIDALLPRSPMLMPPSSGNPIGTLIRRIRSMIVAINMSPKRINMYKCLCEAFKLVDCNKLSLDCSTRWNSTLNMINQALSKRIVLEKMAVDCFNLSKDDFTITDGEWSLLEDLSCMLEPFAEATEILGKSKRVTISNVMNIVTGLFTLLENDIMSVTEKASRPGLFTTSEQLRSLTCAYNAMIWQLTKYARILKRNPLYIMATALDPSKKLVAIESMEHRLVREKLVTLLSAQGEDIRSNQHSNKKSMPKAHEHTATSHSSGKRFGRLEDFVSKLEYGMDGTVTALPLMDEVNEYLRSQIERAAEPLTWWKEIGRFRYPKLAVLAKDFLSINVTGAAAKHLFSTKRCIATHKRASLTPETMSMLMTMKCWAWEGDVVAGRAEVYWD